MSYYTINEEAARTANDLNSHYTYREGSATASYSACVSCVLVTLESLAARSDHSILLFFQFVHRRELPVAIVSSPSYCIWSTSLSNTLYIVVICIISRIYCTVNVNFSGLQDIKKRRLARFYS